VSQRAGTELGPQSLLWRWAGDTRIAFLGSSIGLLQLMHPAIGAAVLEHSSFFEDPSDRVFRSLPRILGAAYDDPGRGTGTQVRDLHRGISGVDRSGAAYDALDPATFWWAHATFQYMTEQVADHWDRHRLTEAERERLYREGVEWYRRYGVDDGIVPPDRASFQEAWDRVCTDVLEVNDAVRFVLDALEAPSLPRWHPRAPIPEVIRPVADSAPARRLMARSARVAAIGGLPPVVRERFGLPWRKRDQAELVRMRRLVRHTWRFMPASVRWQPRARAGWNRVGVRAP
jgi:uncharacterized protein (DUF2236 family)